MHSHDLLIMMGLIIAVSIGTELLAERLRVPAILPLLIVGVLLGPEALNLVQPDLLGDGLRVLIPLIVAIIVFEGGMVLDLTYLRQVSPVVRNLITLGCLLTAVLGGLAAHFLAGLEWRLAMIFGALVSVTGPTVVNPLMRRAAVTQRLKTILMAEGVLVDAVGAVLAVVVLEAVISNSSPLAGANDWALRVLGGVLIGLLGGWLLGRGLRAIGRAYTAGWVRLGALGGALAIYTLAEVFRAESGIPAVAAAGLVVGNMRFPHEEEAHSFKGDLTMIGIGIIFVLLAARLRFADLLALGWGGLAAVAALIFLIRPISIFFCTLGSRLSRREKLFLSAVSPRGIVAASFATFAALRLEDAGYRDASSMIGLVFLLIIGTIVIQSFTTGWLAKLLGVQPMLTLIIGADALGRDLASHLQAQSEEVVLVDRDTENAAKARAQHLTVFEGDATDEALLHKAGIGRARALVATTASDKTNLLVCQLARSRFGITELVARANDGVNVKMFAELDIRAMSPNAAAVLVLDNLLRRPNTLRLLTDLDSGKEVREVTLRNTDMVGKPIREITLRGDVLIAMVRRGERLFVPHGATTLEAGDQMTLIGNRDDVAAGIVLFDPAQNEALPQDA